MKIVVLDGYTANPGDLSWEEFEKLGETVVYERTPYEDKVIAERIGDAEIVLTNKTPISAATMDACPSMRYVGVLATGFNIVDVKAAADRDITVCNIPSYSTNAVAQFVFALLLEICHHAGHHSDEVHKGRWSNSADFCFWDYPLIELAGKTIGLIGFGSIGRATAKIAAALGMKVLAYNRSISEEGKKLAEYVSLEELLKRSDVVSLQCPLNAESRGLINEKTIAMMKDGAILINTARGPVIDDAAVAAALNSGKLYAAGVDVATVEPISADNPLLSAKNCIITPHIAWAPTECRVRLMDIALKNLQAFLDGNTVNRVN